VKKGVDDISELSRREQIAIELRRAKNNEYAKAYRKRHPDRVKAAQVKYWLGQAEKELERREA